MKTENIYVRTLKTSTTLLDDSYFFVLFLISSFNYWRFCMWKKNAMLVFFGELNI